MLTGLKPNDVSYFMQTGVTLLTCFHSFSSIRQTPIIKLGREMSIGKRVLKRAMRFCVLLYCLQLAFMIFVAQ